MQNIDALKESLPKLDVLKESLPKLHLLKECSPQFYVIIAFLSTSSHVLKESSHFNRFLPRIFSTDTLRKSLVDFRQESVDFLKEPIDSLRKDSLKNLLTSLRHQLISSWNPFISIEFLKESTVLIPLMNPRTSFKQAIHVLRDDRP